MRELVQTTALPTIAGNLFRLGDKAVYEPHDWWSPYRTLQMFDFLSKPIDVEGPKFVFAHIIKTAYTGKRSIGTVISLSISGTEMMRILAN